MSIGLLKPMSFRCITSCASVQRRPPNALAESTRINPVKWNCVDWYVNMNKPDEMRVTMTSTEDVRFSSLKRIAKNRMKITHVDFVIVYSEMVMNSKLQLDSPMSSDDAIPVTANFFQDTDHGIDTLTTPQSERHNSLIPAASKYLITRWHRTTERGKWNPFMSHFW